MATPPSTAPAAPASEPKKSITRRRFLRVAAGVGATIAAGAAGIASFDWFGLRTATTWNLRGVRNYARAYSWAFLPPADRIKRHFDYLTLADADVTRFVRDYEKKYGRVTPRAVEANRLLYSKFLMSTDFFMNGADVSRPVKYVALHDPYVSPCWSPFPAPKV